LHKGQKIAAKGTDTVTVKQRFAAGRISTPQPQ